MVITAEDRTVAVSFMDDNTLAVGWLNVYCACVLSRQIDSMSEHISLRSCLLEADYCFVLCDSSIMIEHVCMR